MIRLLTLILILFTAACSTVPQHLRGEYAALQPQDSASENQLGERVLWGGTIISIDNQADHSCIEILSKPLASDARPLHTQTTLGRFLACSNEFFDPEQYPKGHEITVAGAIDSMSSKYIGEYRYDFPIVDADAIHFWAPVQDNHRYLIYQGWSIGPGWYWHYGLPVGLYYPHHFHNPGYRPPGGSNSRPPSISPQRSRPPASVKRPTVDQVK